MVVPRLGVWSNHDHYVLDGRIAAIYERGHLEGTPADASQVKVPRECANCARVTLVSFLYLSSLDRIQQRSD